MRSWHRGLYLCALFAVASCAGGEGPGPLGPVHVDLESDPPKRLSDYDFFRWDPQAGFTFNEGVVPYDLNTPLFSDYALKQRAIYIPPGSHATFDPENRRASAKTFRCGGQP